LLLYALWGLLLGIWIGRLPRIIEQKRAETIAKIQGVSITGDDISLHGKGKKQQKFQKMALILLFIITVFLAGWYESYLHKTLYIILRTIAVIALFYWVINPLVNRLMQRWIKKRGKGDEFHSVMNSLPEMKLYIRPAYNIAKEYKGLKR